MSELSKTSLGLSTIAALLVISARVCQCGGLTDLLESSSNDASESDNIIHKFEIGFNKDAVAAEILRLVDESKLEVAGSSPKYREFAKRLQPIRDSNRPSVLRKLGQVVRETLAPISDYVSLVARYRRWLKQYAHLKEQASGQLRPALDVFREEYAKTDELLEKKQQAGKCGQGDKVDTETVDFIFQVLKKLIDRLEWRLNADRQRLGYSVSGAHQEVASLPDDERRVQKSLGKVKDVAVKTVSRQLVAESFRVTRIAIFKMLASAMTNNYYPVNDVRYYISKIVCLLSGGDTSVVVSYLRDIQFRAALVAVRQVSLKPVYSCFVDNKQQESQGD